MGDTAKTVVITGAGSGFAPYGATADAAPRAAPCVAPHA